MSSRKRRQDSDDDYDQFPNTSICSSDSGNSSPSSMCSNNSKHNFISSSPVQSKRIQMYKIHTEVHQKTIDIMTKAQLKLQRQEKHKEIESNFVNDVKMEEECKTNYHQKPYW
ncbi:uncharacterized protein KGF55_000922 [Candida pseudojiufengensis]|uniref:uncharacterized protein n=1 Tax=Candida pseudojiufengensis TaxID=497109 RepID=UPI002224CC5F|nr:uncharacterized protein KGF55_000922 [Candida pseudojiufengensis]KAI5965560.1 hypothetical protein KGF55_000922 [Candida pseudojiufengensis]